MTITAKFILESIEGDKFRAMRLAQCVLYGLVEPSDVDITAAMHLGMSEAMVVELHDALLENSIHFVQRAQRAFQWAVRDNVEPEFGIFMGERLRALIAISGEIAPDANEIFKTQEFKAYVTKFKPILNNIHVRN